ncbi:hypothetical protein A4G99_10700 [Haladaptatus sp. R4]|nr:hypothetical protein A4G99_10700 [Haladaptatus sp. R4]
MTTIGHASSNIGRTSPPSVIELLDCVLVIVPSKRNTLTSRFRIVLGSTNCAVLPFESSFRDPRLYPAPVRRFSNQSFCRTTFELVLTRRSSGRRLNTP